MHKYSILNNKKENCINIIYAVMLFLSLFVTMIINTCIKSSLNELVAVCKLKEWNNVIKTIKIIDSLNPIPGASVICIFSLLKLVFDKWLWRLFKGLIGVPNINGKWKGKLISSYGIEIDMKMDIKQNLDKLQVTCYFNESASKSCMAALDVQNFSRNKSWEMQFSYNNHNINNDNHVGFNIVNYEQNIATNQYYLAGEYFTNRTRENSNDRGTYGTFMLSKY